MLSQFNASKTYNAVKNKKTVSRVYVSKTWENEINQYIYIYIYIDIRKKILDNFFYVQLEALAWMPKRFQTEISSSR